MEGGGAPVALREGHAGDAAALWSVVGGRGRRKGSGGGRCEVPG